MKSFRLLLAALVLLLMTTPQTAFAAGQSACILLIDPNSKAVQQLEQLHSLIDVLPETTKLGLDMMPSNQSEALQLRALDRDTRAAMHLRLQDMGNSSPVTERQLIAAVQQAIRTLARVPGERMLILATESVSQSDGWDAVVTEAVDSHVKVVLLTGDASAAAFDHPLVRRTMGRQIGITGTLLTDLIQVCGLVSAELETGINQDRSASFALEADTLQFTIIFSQPAGGVVEVVGPAGRAFALDADAPGSVYSGINYLCWHLAREQSPVDYGWEGRWSIKTAAQSLGVWLLDSIEVRVDASITDGKRLLTSSVWRMGERLSSSELKGQRFQLILPDGDSLLSLNDAGISGDLVPGDGVFSVALPDHLLPAAGSALVQAVGRIQRMSPVYIDALPVISHASRPREWRLLGSGVLILTGVAGTFVSARRRPAERVLRHVSASGYHRVIPLGPKPVVAGSGRRCRVRIGANSAAEHLRFRLSRGEVNIDVLVPEPGTYINGQRVYLSKVLQHDDEIIVGSDTIILQDRRQSRIGRRVGVMRQENRS